MCGICGIVSKNPVQHEQIRAMSSALSHRGPDAQGVFVDASGMIALGHTRLSIIDLSQEANQPMFLPDGRLGIVFNGEIYNYNEIRRQLSGVTFRTSSDTETILHAFEKWGMAMVDKLEGMFAMAIYDARSNRICLLRDRVGKKPLYYYHDGERFVFASEIKSILKDTFVSNSTTVDLTAVQRFLHLGYVPSPHTIYSTIKKLPAGCFATIDRDLNLRIEKYWEIDRQIPAERISDERSAIQTLQRELDDAVKRRLVSDVPVGAFLSGGTDSSLVTAMAMRLTGTPIKTFNIGFENERFDERPFARAVANRLGTDHQEYLLTERAAIESIDEYINHFDEPFADTSAIPTMLVSKLARKEVKVVLTGDGGDELFMGYGAYDWARRLSRPLVQIMKGPARVLFSTMGNDRLQRVAHLLERVPQTSVRSHIFSQEQYLFSQAELAAGLIAPGDELSYSDPANLRTPEERQAVFDLKFYLPDDLLTKVDRASMRYALECRCPLLDHNIVALSLSFDDSLKIRHGKRKWILTRLLEDHLPRELVHRKKHGFSIPLSDWLKGDLKYLIDRHLSRHSVDNAGMVKWDFVSKSVDAFQSGQNFMYNRVWALVVLHKWITHHKS